MNSQKRASIYGNGRWTSKQQKRYWKKWHREQIKLKWARLGY